MKNLRVLVVDDSAFNRRTLGELLDAIPGVEVVGKAGDGEEALRCVAELVPDLITLDLEMPRMDGFTFLRLLMAKKPTPVIVVSGYSARHNVFRALELGALDFVAKLDHSVVSDLERIREELVTKIDLVRGLTPGGYDPRFRAQSSEASGRRITSDYDRAVVDRPKALRQVVAVGASTGGPTALLELFSRFPRDSHTAVVVAQHMPARFTKTFAERLDRLDRFSVREASDSHVLRAGQAFVCPGGKCMEVVKQGSEIAVEVRDGTPEDRYVPSVDALLRSAAQAMPGRVVGVVLTGMGEDGAQGAVAIKEAGGTVWVEAPETAVIFGMPAATLRTGAADRSLPIDDLANHLASSMV